MFAAMVGYASFSFTLHHGQIVRNDAETFWLWIPMALVGIFFLVLRNRQLPNSGPKWALILGDLLVIAGELLLIRVVPDAFGLVKGGLVWIVAAIYVSVYITFLYQGKFVAKTA